MLEIRDLHSYYGEAHVLHGASLTVPDGEVVALLGRNGMGKTTLIRSVMRLAQPGVREGSIRWRDEELIGLAPHEVARRRIALVPQGRRLFPSLTVLEHLTMLRPPRGDASGGWSVERLFMLFPRLAERKGHRGGQLSGGERQMLAIARALVIDPQLILMDEPSEGLAPVMVQALEGIILELKRAGLTILLVEQNFYSALAAADRVYVMETGRIVHEAPADDVRAAPESLMRYLGVH
ncbi:MAG TPA: ABC transporter ATP-binding protein [Zeimonas sp.]